MSHPTRSALLDAGLKLAEVHGLAHMSIDQIVREAGVAKGTFYVHFTDRVAFLVELHIRFHEHLKELILNGIEGLAPGAERLYHATTIYLDGCLNGKAVKALLLEARSEPAISTVVQERNADFALLAAEDFRTMGWADADSAARLYVAMGAEAALVELESGGKNEAIRRALRYFLQTC